MTMKKNIKLFTTIASFLIISCTPQNVDTEQKTSLEQHINISPKEMLKEAYQLFKEGNDEKSIEIANRVLEIGRKENNDTLIGGALSSLCRNAQRSLDTTRLEELSEELVALAAASGNKEWLMKRAHMNAEMWRLIGNMDRAERFYNESMQISNEIGSNGMYMIDHFNKSFVSTAKGNYEEANELIKRYYQLRAEYGYSTDDPYGLIALAYLLEQQENYKDAHEVAAVTRRLFKEQKIFPEPPDEKPLLAVEKKVSEMLNEGELSQISNESTELSVTDLLEKYLK